MSTYAVNKLCRLVVHEADFREELRADPQRATSEFQPPLSEEERSALLTGDVGRLSVMGAHDFQLYQLQRFEMFGITLNAYIESMKGAHR